MLPSKPRSSLSASSNNKTPPATPKVSKIPQAGSTKSEPGPSPLQKSHISPRSNESKPTIGRRSPKISSVTPDLSKSVESKPTVQRRSPKTSTTPDKQLQALKGSELQAQLIEVQGNLEKAKEQLAFSEKEGARVLEELKDAKKLTDEASDKLKDALAAQKKAEESSEIEKFRADELEQASIEASQKKEEELDSIKTKHSLDVETLLSTTQELEKIKNELEATTKVKNTALTQAEDAMKITEVNAEKVELLSVEVSHLKSLLDSKLDSANSTTEELIKKLNSEVGLLKCELERAKQAEEKLTTMESLIENLRSELDNAKSAGLDSLKKSESLEIALMETKQSENSTLESLASLKNQLEESKASLQDAELETTSLLEKVELLEDQLAEAKKGVKSSLESQSLLAKQLEEVGASLQDSESETAVLKGKVESLEIDVADVNKEKLDSDKLAEELKKKAEFLETQLAEANQLKDSSSEYLASVTKQFEESNSSLHDSLTEIAELRMKIDLIEVELARYKEEHMDSEKEKIEMEKTAEGLKSEIQTLQEEKSRALDSEKVAASEAVRFVEEKNNLLKELEMAREEEEKAKMAMEGLASALHEMSAEGRETRERFLAQKDEHEDARAQIAQLRSTLINTEENYEAMLNEARHENVSLKEDIERLEGEAKEKESEWDAKELNFVRVIKMSEEELVSFKAQMGNVKEDGEEMVAKLKEAESRASRANEAVEEAKAKTLRLKERLLDRENELQSISQENAELRIREAASIKQLIELSASLAEATTTKTEENGELRNSEKDNGLLLDLKEISIDSVNGSKEEKLKSGEENGNVNQYIAVEKSVETKVKRSEDSKDIEKDKDFSTEMENEGESIDDSDSKMESDSSDQRNGLPLETIEDGEVSPTNQKLPKKKKPLLQKFGSLLKKKSAHK